MKLIKILPLLILGILVAACTPEVVCNKPYIRVGTGCCVDVNNNYICDSDETESTIAVGSAVEVLSTEKTAATETESNTESTVKNTEETDNQEATAEEEISIEITSMFWSTISPKTGSENELTIEFKNTGDKSVPEFTYILKLYIDDDLESNKEYTYDDLLASGQEVKEEHSFDIDKAGKYKAEVYIKGDEDNTQTAKATGIENEEDDTDDDEETSGSCSDSDGGSKFSERGSCKDGTDTYTDECPRDNLLIEYYCAEDDTCKSMVNTCTCIGGKCI